MTGKKSQEAAPAGPEQQVFVELIRTSSEKMAGMSRLLKDHGLSEPQYNVLRILRGAGKDGLPCRQIAGRMLTRLPDITRLVDRLEKAGHADRVRSEEDRRIIRVRITPRGLRLLSGLDTPVSELHRDQFAHMTRDELRRLGELLTRAREG